jgi:hypothetical protein
MSDLNWQWDEIAVVLFWRLAPHGVTITRKDLAALPMERVLLEDRRPTEIRFSWISIDEAQKRHKPTDGLSEAATVDTIEGSRWKKIAAVLLWKKAKDGIVITPLDRSMIPNDKILMASGHANDIEYRFLPRSEAATIQRQERDNRGKIILENGQRL